MNDNEIVGIFDRETAQTPQQILSSFFQEYSLEDVNYFLWLMLKTTLASADEVFDYPQNRDELIFRYETMRRFIEAVYKINGAKPISNSAFQAS